MSETIDTRQAGQFFGKYAMEKFVTISGCSGGGKSTLLAELRRRGHAIVEEPGRRIAVEELQRDGRALPWVDAVAFARRAIAMSLADRAAAAANGAALWVFFDRGLIDAAAALQHLTREPAIETFGTRYGYNRCVFVTPPWPEIFVTDEERRHSLTEAIAEYECLVKVYPTLGYEVCLLPKVTSTTGPTASSRH